MKARVLVKGKVQSVGYRNFIRLVARYNNIKGTVRNLGDGTCGDIC